jgi:hypothetical protein
MERRQTLEECKQQSPGWDTGVEHIPALILFVLWVTLVNKSNGKHAA